MPHFMTRAAINNLLNKQLNHPNQETTIKPFKLAFDSKYGKM